MPWLIEQHLYMFLWTIFLSSYTRNAHQKIMYVFGTVFSACPRYIVYIYIEFSWELLELYNGLLYN